MQMGPRNSKLVNCFREASATKAAFTIEKIIKVLSVCGAQKAIFTV